MADTRFTFVEDLDDGQFYIIMPDGEDTDWTPDEEIAVFDDGTTTYAATNCDDFPGMQAGIVYALGAAMPTDTQDYAGMEDEEDAEDPAEGAEEEEDAELEAEEQAE